MDGWMDGWIYGFFFFEDALGQRLFSHCHSWDLEGSRGLCSSSEVGVFPFFSLQQLEFGGSSCDRYIGQGETFFTGALNHSRHDGK